MTSARQLLLALDAGAPLSDLVGLGLSLAKGQQAELAAWFVEDAALLRCAGLACVHQVNLGTAAAEPFDLASIERELHALALHARSLIAAGARHERIPWSFRVVREGAGAPFEALPATADLLLIRGGASVRGEASSARFPRSPWVLGREGRLPSADVLRLAADLAGDSLVQLVVQAPAPGAARRLELELQAILGQAAQRFRARELPAGTEVLGRALAEARGGPVILEVEHSLDVAAACSRIATPADAILATVLVEARCPVLLVRAPA